jgi:hypothetical protein
MNRKWLALAVLVAAAISLLSVASCGDPQTLQSITIQPGTETVGAANIPLTQDVGFQVQLSAMGNYLHPPVTKDITNQVTWASNTPQMFAVSATGLLTATAQACGSALVSASLTTNSDGSGVSSSGAVVTGSMTANLVCFTSTGPTITVDSSGMGAGTVSSSPAGLGCALSGGSSCTGSFPTGTTVTLSAAVTSGTTASWAGCDSPPGNSVCVIDDLTTDVTVTVSFN